MSTNNTLWYRGYAPGGEREDLAVQFCGDPQSAPAIWNGADLLGYEEDTKENIATRPTRVARLAEDGEKGMDTHWRSPADYITQRKARTGQRTRIALLCLVLAGEAITAALIERAVWCEPGGTVAVMPAGRCPVRTLAGDPAWYRWEWRVESEVGQ